ncbi:MAG TPA: DNA translocase FtsK, partial [Candidatus Paceibacterota bacterium]|nr:DNA translocase FtsK [Candidatus Paceibacterota bacterium]
MAKNEKNYNKKKNSKINSPTNKLKNETKHAILAVVFFVLALFLFMTMFEIGGPAGKFIHKIFGYLLGIGYVLLPILFILLGSSFVKSERPDIGVTRTISSLMFLLSGLGIIDIASTNSGGFLGRVLSVPFVYLFDVSASVVFLGAILIISLLIMFDARPALVPFFKKLLSLFKKTPKEEEEEYEEKEEEMKEEEIEKKEEKKEEKIEKTKKSIWTGKDKKEEEEELPIKNRKSNLNSNYVPPPLSLLEEDQGKPNTGDIKANANIIKRTLANFGIEVEMDEITVGPTVTRYALKPAEGVKLSRIVGLQNDLALALAA